MLTIIVPIYNTENYLSECIDSILNQSYKDIELILINDGSTDNSSSICDEYSSKDKRIKVIHIENRGVSYARNIGLSIAKGEYITFVDSDDFVSNDIYLENIKILEQNLSIDFIQIPINDEKITPCTISTQKDLFDAWIFFNKKITNYFCDKIFRRKYFEELRFPLNMRYEDRYLFSDILKSINKIYCSVHGCYYYRQHALQITKQNNLQLKKDMINANFHTLKNIPSNCNNSYIRCFWDTLILIQSISNESFEKNWTRKMKEFTPTFKMIWLSQNPNGIKIRLSLKKILNHKTYLL